MFVHLLKTEILKAVQGPRSEVAQLVKLSVSVSGLWRCCCCTQLPVGTEFSRTRVLVEANLGAGDHKSNLKSGAGSLTNF